jgi:hypothetical protein
MPVRVDNLESMLWQWHDAHVLNSHIVWLENGERNLHIRCRVNPEESRDALVQLGITTELVDIEFRDIVEAQTTISGFQSSHEVILTWQILRASTMIERIKWPLDKALLIHHHIECSGGSIFDIVGGDVWIAEVDDTF